MDLGDLVLIVFLALTIGAYACLAAAAVVVLLLSLKRVRSHLRLVSSNVAKSAREAGFIPPWPNPPQNEKQGDGGYPPLARPLPPMPKPPEKKT